jgi:methanogenic corrinoid protein MtbC1
MTSTRPAKFITSDQPLAHLATAYYEAMLECERNRAIDLVMHAVDGGVALRDLYLHVFQPVQRQIGWLWQTNEISVGHEHYCSNCTQLIMSMLHPVLFRGPRHGKRLVATCVQGELHEIGLRIVSDFFEMDGWRTTYLGANMPCDGILSCIRETKADALAIGVTLRDHLDEAERLIRAVRSAKPSISIPILVGGYALLAVDSLWEQLGADGTAQDADHALEIIAELTG